MAESVDRWVNDQNQVLIRSEVDSQCDSVNGWLCSVAEGAVSLSPTASEG